MMLPILISLSVTPGSYFFCAAAGFAAAERLSVSNASRMPRFAAMPTSPDAAGFPPIQRQSRVRPSGLSSFGWRRGDFRQLVDNQGRKRFDGAIQHQQIGGGKT